MSKLKNLLRLYIPRIIIEGFRKYTNKHIRQIESKMIEKASFLHETALDKVKTKEGPINVVFFALIESVWKYDYLYWMMHNDPRFNPKVLVCPIVNYGIENMLRNLNQCFSFFKERGYDVMLSYDVKSDSYVDVENQLYPDIIFYTNPYKGLIDDRYYIDKFMNHLTCYTNYFFNEGNHYNISCDLLFQNLLWKKFIESNFDKNKYIKYQRRKGENTVVTGYPGIDKYIDSSYEPKDVWKIKNNNIKRIIWAPHHTIDDYNVIQYGTFFKFAVYMLELAHKYRKKIQIAFKPHPLLINRLYLKWGKEKTDAYYEKWKNLENGMLCDGPYQDLFLTSDAIMHDSGSFILEYLFTGKPALHLDNGIAYESQYNELAIEALSHYYHATTEAEIEDFIKLLIDNKDPKSIERKRFVEEKLLPPNGKLASQNIFDDLVKSLGLDQTNG